MIQNPAMYSLKEFPTRTEIHLKPELFDHKPNQGDNISESKILLETILNAVENDIASNNTPWKEYVIMMPYKSKDWGKYNQRVFETVFFASKNMENHRKTLDKIEIYEALPGGLDSYYEYKTHAEYLGALMLQKVAIKAIPIGEIKSYNIKRKEATPNPKEPLKTIIESELCDVTKNLEERLKVNHDYLKAAIVTAEITYDMPGASMQFNKDGKTYRLIDTITTEGDEGKRGCFYRSRPFQI